MVVMLVAVLCPVRVTPLPPLAPPPPLLPSTGAGRWMESEKHRGRVAALIPWRVLEEGKTH